MTERDGCEAALAEMIKKNNIETQAGSDDKTRLDLYLKCIEGCFLS